MHYGNEMKAKGKGKMAKESNTRKPMPLPISKMPARPSVRTKPKKGPR